MKLFIRLWAPPARRVSHWLARHDRGQATVEYVLLLLGAAAIATLVLAWATGSGKIGDLLDAVVDSLLSKVT